MKVTDAMVERAAREMHHQRRQHPYEVWDGHCLTAARAVLEAALRQPPVPSLCEDGNRRELFAPGSQPSDNDTEVA